MKQVPELISRHINCIPVVVEMKVLFFDLMHMVNLGDTPSSVGHMVVGIFTVSCRIFVHRFKTLEKGLARLNHTGTISNKCIKTKRLFMMYRQIM